MTVESDNTHRLERLEKRVDKIEDSINVNLQRIFEALDEMRVSHAENKCPAPGACVGLGKELEHAIVAHNATMLRVERLELAILKVEQLTIMESRNTERKFAQLDTQKAWILGAWSVVAFLASIIGAVAVIALRQLFEKL